MFTDKDQDSKPILQRVLYRGLTIKPEIEIIKLDNEISLALESNPLEGPDEAMMDNIEQQMIDPFKNSSC